MLLEEIKEGVADLLFPKTCFGCGKEGKYICDNCNVFLGESALICPVCDKLNFTGQKHLQCSTKYGLDGLVNIWEYEGITKAALHDIKYKGNFDIISEFIEKAFLVMRKDISRFESFLSFIFSKDVYIVYVPMYIKKEKRRGFNQSKIIARELEKITEKKTIDLLEKIKDTPSQTNLDREGRIKNVKDCFRILPNSTFLPKKVVLVDDLWQTGATLKECCEIIKTNGVEEVWGFTLFRQV
ncbi:hypothetical protein KKA72_02610 [Patescibacteria group bacterium]|nr:hypothetical protein [Patescibacteria group bacterium]MBU1877205.1 hypothetical protein [Patescibacteria group bacterium]